MAWEVFLGREAPGRGPGGECPQRERERESEVKNSKAHLPAGGGLELGNQQQTNTNMSVYILVGLSCKHQRKAERKMLKKKLWFGARPLRLRLRVKERKQKRCRRKRSSPARNGGGSALLASSNVVGSYKKWNWMDGWISQ